MKNESNQENQWLVFELKICRIIIGMTQAQLAKLLGQSLESIKRIETKIGDPKHRTISRIRKIYNHFGISYNIETSGNTTLVLDSDLVAAINEGELKVYSSNRGKTLDFTEPEQSVKSVVLKDLVCSGNQWLMLEIKLCRIISGLTQQILADLMGMRLDGIKRIEKKGSDTRYSTINKLRRIFDYMGVRCSFDDYGKLTISLREELIEVINNGGHTEYKTTKPLSFQMDAAPIKFE